MSASNECCRIRVLAGSCCWLVAALVSSVATWGETGDRIVLPDLSTRVQAVSGGQAGFQRRRSAYSKSGFQIVVDTRGVGTIGYRPVRVQLSSQAKSTADRQVTIRLSAAGRHQGPRAITVERDFEFPLGLQSAEVTMLVPQFVEWNNLQWDVWIDGVKDDDLGTRYVGFNSSGGGNAGAAFVLEYPGLSTAASDGAPSTIPADRFDLVARSQLFAEWTSYSNSNTVFTSRRHLEQFNASNPDGIKTLMRWVRAGGSLWIVDGGKKYEQLPDIERQLGIAPEAEAATNNTERAVSLAWKAVRVVTGESPINEEYLALFADRDQSILEEIEPRGVLNGPFSSNTDLVDLFTVRPYGMGMIVVCRNSGIDGISRMPIALEKARSSPLAKWMDWTMRHGNNPNLGNVDFNNFLIPDVGLAPVYEFQFLITLFVLGIGPLNYWLFKRRGKLPMMLATVPAAALLTTGLLFAYGYLSEGMGTQVRVRSFASLDQRAGEVASWSRLSYYAAIAPSEGLTLPADTVMYPILPNASRYRSRRRYANQPRVVMLEESGRAHLSEGWLASRTPLQYLSITARKTEKRLEIEKLEDSLRVENHLGTDIVMVAICDDSGDYYFAEGISAGDDMVLQFAEKPDVITALRKAFSDNEPQFPVGGEFVGVRDDYESSVSEGLLEVNLNAIIAPTVSEWNRRSYVAITKEGIAIELGLDNVEARHCFHVIRGSW